jgi:hypothetical protein
MFKGAKIGDKVWYIGRGWGTIVDIVPNSSYPIVVEFKLDQVISFLVDGRLFIEDEYPVLFWNEVVISDSAYKKPLPKDTKVLVWDIDEFEALKRHFSHFDKDGRIWVFNCGTTSWSSNTVSSWPNYKIVEENE